MQIPTDIIKARAALVATAQDAHHYLASLVGDASTFDAPGTLAGRLERYATAFAKLLECATLVRASLGENLAPRLATLVDYVVDAPDPRELESEAQLKSEARKALRRFGALMIELEIDAYAARDLTKPVTPTELQFIRTTCGAR